MAKALMIVCDGMADRPVRKLGGKTPLEVCTKPNLDRLAEVGVNGLMDPIAPGVRPGSDTAHLALLGYDPFKTYSGRGALEALGLGFEVAQGDVCLRCNFGTVREDFTIVDRRAGRYIDEAEDLADALNGIKLKTDPKVEVIFKHSTEHRAVLILRGEGLSPMVSDTDPHVVNVKVQEAKPRDSSPEALKTARIINEFTYRSYEVLSRHQANWRRKVEGKLPANIVLMRGAGVKPSLDPLSKLYGVKAVCIAEVALVKGVCRAVGMDIINVPGATGGVDSKLENKAEAAIKALGSYDLIFINVKGCDAASHDGRIDQKIDMIKKIDFMVGLILNNISLEETYLTMLADHATPLSVRDHTGDPVPVTIAGPEVLTDGVACFSEREAAKGSLGRIRGVDLMPILMNYLGKAEKFGE